MTQTIHHEVLNTEDRIAYDVYYHPNNRSAKLDDPDIKYRFTVYATKFTVNDLADWVKDTVDFGNDDAVEELHNIIDCFKKSKEDYIWRCQSENGHDDYSDFCSDKYSAECSLTNEDC